MTDTKRSVLNLYYAAAEGNEPSSADMADAGIPVRLHDQVRREARALLVDYYSSNDKSSVRHEAQRLGTRLAASMPDTGWSSARGSKDEMLRMPTLDGRRHPIAAKYLTDLARGQRPKSRDLLALGIPEDQHHLVMAHTEKLGKIWGSGSQQDARDESIRLATELIGLLGSDYEESSPRADDVDEDDPRALAEQVARRMGAIR